MKRLLLDRKMYVEFGLAAVLFAANILLTLFLPYLTEHKRYYDSGAYITVLAIAFAIYAFGVHFTRKKSASDIAVVVFAFFAIWETAYKTGTVKNDLAQVMDVLDGLLMHFISGNDKEKLKSVKADLDHYKSRRGMEEDAE